MTKEIEDLKCMLNHGEQAETETPELFYTKPNGVIREWEQYGNKLLLLNTGEWIYQVNDSFLDKGINASLYSPNQIKEKVHFINLSKMYSKFGVFSEIRKYFNKHIESILSEYATKEELVLLCCNGKDFGDYREKILAYEKKFQRDRMAGELLCDYEKFLDSFSDLFEFKKYERVFYRFADFKKKNQVKIKNVKIREFENPFKENDTYFINSLL